jgi:hypothetical protein
MSFGHRLSALKSNALAPIKSPGVAMSELGPNEKDQVTRRVHRGLLLSAAVGFGILWICVVMAAEGAVHGTWLVLLGSAGVLFSVALLPLVNRHEEKLDGLAEHDALTGLGAREAHRSSAAPTRAARAGRA